MEVSAPQTTGVKLAVYITVEPDKWTEANQTRWDFEMSHLLKRQKSHGHEKNALPVHSSKRNTVYEALYVFLKWDYSFGLNPSTARLI